MNREAERKRLVGLINGNSAVACYLPPVAIRGLADHLLDNGVTVVDEALTNALFRAVNALADMVNQFGYSTTFRRQEAVCDGGLSALEEAFYALELCGARVNSNGTINRKNLIEFKIENIIEEYLEGKYNV